MGRGVAPSISHVYSAKEGILKMGVIEVVIHPEWRGNDNPVLYRAMRFHSQPYPVYIVLYENGEVTADYDHDPTHMSRMRLKTKLRYVSGSTRR